LDKAALANETPAVTVIIPVYNAGPWIGMAMDSILAQSFRSLELLVVDDGSTDRSLAEIEARAVKDGRVRVFRQRNSGPAAALNMALAEARGALMARLDADDVAHERRLERQVAYLAEHADVGAVGAWAMDIDGDGRPRGRVRKPDTDPATLKHMLMRRNPFVHSAVTARTEIVRRVGGYRSAFDLAEDYDLWLRVAETAELANLPEVLVSYRVHDGSGSQHPLRQAFSARLARRCATARQMTGVDPAVTIPKAPDWRAELDPAAFFAEDAALYRWLDGCSRAEDMPACLNQLLNRASDLTHNERRLAARAVWTRIRGADRQDAARTRQLLLRLFRLRPSTVLRAAWSLRD
jgi:glycosyltransferase involved in cell wall biosynthesis